MYNFNLKKHKVNNITYSYDKSFSEALSQMNMTLYSFNKLLYEVFITQFGMSLNENDKIMISLKANKKDTKWVISCVYGDICYDNFIELVSKDTIIANTRGDCGLYKNKLPLDFVDVDGLSYKYSLNWEKDEVEKQLIFRKGIYKNDAILEYSLMDEFNYFLRYEDDTKEIIFNFSFFNFLENELIDAFKSGINIEDDIILLDECFNNFKSFSGLISNFNCLLRLIRRKINNFNFSLLSGVKYRNKITNKIIELSSDDLGSFEFNYSNQSKIIVRNPYGIYKCEIRCGDVSLLFMGYEDYYGSMENFFDETGMDYYNFRNFDYKYDSISDYLCNNVDFPNSIITILEQLRTYFSDKLNAFSIGICKYDSFTGKREIKEFIDVHNGICNKCKLDSEYIITMTEGNSFGDFIDNSTGRCSDVIISPINNNSFLLSTDNYNNVSVEASINESGVENYKDFLRLKFKVCCGDKYFILTLDNSVGRKHISIDELIDSVSFVSLDKTTFKEGILKYLMAVNSVNGIIDLYDDIVDVLGSSVDNYSGINLAIYDSDTNELLDLIEIYNGMCVKLQVTDEKSVTCWDKDNGTKYELNNGNRIVSININLEQELEGVIKSPERSVCPISDGDIVAAYASRDKVLSLVGSIVRRKVL